MKSYWPINAYSIERLTAGALTSLLYLTFTPPEAHAVKHTFSKVRLMVNNLNRPPKIIESSPPNTSSLLSAALSNEMALYIKVRKLQWNVLGESFTNLHKLFNNLYLGIEDTIDLLSDRINILGGKATYAIYEGAETSRQNCPVPNSQAEMMSELLSERESTIAEFGKVIELGDCNTDDWGVKDFLKDVMEQRKATNSILQNISITIMEGSLHCDGNETYSA